MWFLLLLRLKADKMLCLQQPVLDKIIELPQKATMNGFALFKVKQAEKSEIQIGKQKSSMSLTVMFKLMGLFDML